VREQRELLASDNVHDNSRAYFLAERQAEVPLVNAPHTQNELVEDWDHGYTRELAVFPAGVANKYWPTVKRLDDVYGDRNLFCSCVPMSEYQ
jgi:glycine dehydrogenase